MIERLDHSLDRSKPEIAAAILQTSLAAYRVEAELLQQLNFPPLSESQSDIEKSATHFNGIWKSNELAAVIEYEQSGDKVEIHRLVTEPRYFRQGLARLLMQDLLKLEAVFTVDTGADNQPAIKLYESLGFVITRRYQRTGIALVNLELVNLEHS